MRYALAALLLLTACADTAPGWKTAPFVAIPRLDGGTCYVAKPAIVVDWVAEYARMSKECAATGSVKALPNAET